MSLGVVGVLTTLASPAIVGAATIGGEPVDRFLEWIEATPEINSDIKGLLRSTWQNSVERDGAEFLMQGLAVLSPKFRSLLEAYDAEKHGVCAEIGRGLQADANRFVALNAALYEVKSLTAAERTVEALERIESLMESEGLSAFEQFTYGASELSFLRGYCLVADLRYKDGASALAAFLEGYPAAPQRLTIAAKQMLTELINREPEQIGEVVDLMNNSRSRLSLGDSGQVVQGRQQRILDLLDQLIQEAENREKSCSKCNTPKNKDGSCPNKQCPSHGQKQCQTKPMEESRLPGGAPTEAELRESRRANPAESWGALPPAERERILQALRESFPSRYRQLVEQYYEELARKP